MADYTAIYEAGNALVELFRRNMTPEPINKPELIGLASPYEPEDLQLTVHLVHAEDASSGAASGYVQESVKVQRRAPLPLKLTYLITAHSKAPVQNREGDEQRIMGRVLQVLRDNTQLTADMLIGSLAKHEAKLNVSMSKANFEQMTKFWTHSAKPYKLSVMCQVSSVQIDSNKTRTVGRVKDVKITLDETPVRRKEPDENE